MSKFKKVAVMVSGVSAMAVGVGVGLQVIKTKVLPQGADDSDDKPRVQLVSYQPEVLDDSEKIKSVSVFEDDFQRQEVLSESGSMQSSLSSDWWLNSGGVFVVRDGMAMTNQGEMAGYARWRLAYSVSNPVDTDSGYRPQNIFRLVTRSLWKNFDQSVYFKINQVNLSSSPQRNRSNGLFLFNRYLDGKNIYYVGLRVDGSVIVKKKYLGNYYTMGSANVFSGQYDSVNNPNLIPTGEWIGLKSIVVTESDGSVGIQIFMDLGKTGEWKQVLIVQDDGVKYGGDVIDSSGFAGIRTDFLDVEFSEYRIEEVN